MMIRYKPTINTSGSGYIKICKQIRNAQSLFHP